MLVSFRVLMYNDTPVYKGEVEKEVKEGDRVKEEVIYPLELINKDFIKNSKDRYFLFGNESFTNHIYIRDAILAEESAKEDNDLESFGLRILACSHEFGFEAGWEALSSNPIDVNTKGFLEEVYRVFEEDKIVRLSFRELPITLSTNPNRHGIIRSFPFRTSRLFNIY